MLRTPCVYFGPEENSPSYVSLIIEISLCDIFVQFILGVPASEMDLFTLLSRHVPERL